MWQEGDALYLVMELIPRHDLCTIWNDLSENEKTSICGQLRQAFTDIRSIPSPGIFGNITGGPLPHLYFRPLSDDPRITRPFKTSQALNEGLALHALQQKEHSMQRHRRTEWLANHLSEAIKDQPSIFTHGDFIKQNVIVQEQPASDGQTDRQFLLTGLIDWELSGWYPQYWEYANVLTYALWDDDWETKVDTILDPYPCEAAWLKMVKIEIQGI